VIERDAVSSSTCLDPLAGRHARHRLWRGVSWRELAAGHEAGHALVAWHHKLYILEIRIGDQPPPDGPSKAAEAETTMTGPVTSGMVDFR
jgi:hypothetical protein